MLLDKISSKTKTSTTLLLHHWQIKRNWVLKTYYKIESNDKVKEINIKSRMCYYFDDIIKFGDFDVDNILVDEKLYKNILVYTKL